MQANEIVSQRVLTVPNAISFMRLGLIPIFVLAFATGRDFAALVLMFFIGASDFIDGYVARHFQQVSVLGKLLDPLSDRVAIFAAMIALVFRGTVPFALAAVIMTRDVIVAIVFPILERKGYPRIPVNFPGKAATMAIFWGMGFALLSVVAPHSAEQALRWISVALLVIGAILYWVAGYLYFTEIAKLVRTRTEHPS